MFGRNDSLNNCPTLDSIVHCDKTLFRQRTEDNEEVGVPACNLLADKLTRSDVTVEQLFFFFINHFYTFALLNRIHTAPPTGLVQESIFLVSGIFNDFCKIKNGQVQRFEKENILLQSVASIKNENVSIEQRDWMMSSSETN